MTIQVYGYTVTHMKTTIDIPDDLAIRAKKRAVDLRRPFRELVIEGLRARLDRDDAPTRPASEKSIRWVCHPGGLPADMDLSSRAAMTEWLRSEP